MLKHLNCKFQTLVWQFIEFVTSGDIEVFFDLYLRQNHRKISVNDGTSKLNWKYRESYVTKPGLIRKNENASKRIIKNYDLNFAFTWSCKNHYSEESIFACMIQLVMNNYIDANDPPPLHLREHMQYHSFWDREGSIWMFDNILQSLDCRCFLFLWAQTMWLKRFLGTFVMIYQILSD